MICMVACDGKGVKETTVVSRSWCGMKLWSSLQGHFHVVQFAAVSKKRPSLTNNLVKKGQEGATELHHGAKVEVRRGLHLQWRQNMGSAIQEYEASKCFSARKRKRKWTGWSLKTTRKNWISEGSDGSNKGRPARRKPGNNTERLWGGCGQSGSQHKKATETKPWKKHGRMWKHVKRQLHGAQKRSKGECSRN